MKTPLRKSFATTLTALLTAIGASQPVACDDTEENQPGDSGANLNPQGGSAGTGGVSAGTGGVSAGTGGVNAGTGGAGAGSGSGGAGSGGGVGGAGSGGQVQLGTCLDPKFHQGEESGWLGCAGGIWQKNGPSQCKAHPPTEGPPAASGASCKFDSDCKHLPNGKCMSSGALSPSYTCVSECITDDDCGAGAVCFCDFDVNRCILSNCKQDSDCGEGLLCKGFTPPCSGRVYRVACETPEDTCSSSLDCPSNASNCVVQTDSWKCQGTGGCGRPLAVGEGYSVASLARGGGWA